MAINIKTDSRYGLRVKTCRIEKKMTQDDLGDAVGTSKPYISKIENGKQSLTIEMAKRLAEVFGVRWEYLMLLDEYRTEDEKNKVRASGETLSDVYRGPLAYLGYDVFPATEKPYREGQEQNPTKYLICRRRETDPGKVQNSFSESTEQGTLETIGVISPEEFDDLMNRINAAVNHEVEYALMHRAREATEGERRAGIEVCKRKDSRDNDNMIYNCR